jgi:RNA polymerase sigma-70 factor, ECF subfamily
LKPLSDLKRGPEQRDAAVAPEMTRIREALAARLHQEAGADRWSVPLTDFAAALAASADRGAPGASSANCEAYLRALHLEDLALACACAAGHDGAWEHFVREYRPVLYRSADALEPGGGAREIADALYADLYGLRERDGERQSLFRYFHGRSSLPTWLRAVLAQRYVDTARARRKLDPLADDDSGDASASAHSAPADPDRLRLLPLLQRALEAALAVLGARDRLRLACYYTQALTLAQTGRVLREHEATVSRRLARTRKELRRQIEKNLRRDEGLDDDQISRAFELALEEDSPIDIDGALRKNLAEDRSV